MDQRNSPGTASGFVEGQGDEKEEKKILQEFGRGTHVSEADPSRSALHYGSDYEGGVPPQAREDGGGGAPAASYSVGASDGNEAPTEISLSGGSVAENAAGASVGTITVVDPDAGDTHVFEVSDDRFEVVGGELRLREGVTLDREEAGSIDIEVTAIDSAGASVTQGFSIDVEDVNERPVDIGLSNTTVAENASGAVIGKLTVVDPDAGDTHSFEVSDDRFEVVGGELRLREGVALDHEEAAVIEVKVTATDSGGLSVTESFTIEVVDVNEGPSDVDLSGGVVAENAAGAVVGTISVVDPDAGDSHTFEVSDDRFEVVNGELRLREGVALDHEEAATIEVEVTATDSGGASVTEAFAVSVSDVNEGPGDVSLTGTTVAENAAGAVVGTISVVDPDAGDTHSFEVSDDRFEVVNGELRLREGVALDYEDAATIEVEVTATDSGGASLTESFTIDISDVNEGPSDVSLSGATVAENAAGAVVGTLSVVDADAGDTHTFEVSDDRFEVVNGEVRLREGVMLDHEEAATIEVNVTATDSGGATLTESFTVTVSDVNEGPSDVSITGGTVAENAAGAVVGTLSVVDPDAGDTHSFEVSDDRFEVVNGELRLREGVALDHEDAASVQVEVTVTDSGGATLTESFTIEVTDVNEGPSDVALSDTTVAENAVGAVVGTISVVDPDAGDTHSFEVSDDRFEVANGELRLRDGVALDHEEAATIEVEVTATDSGGAILTESFTIIVADVNEGPSDLSLTGGTVAENVAGAVVGTISVVDPDAGDTHSFEVSDDRFEVVNGELRLRAGVALDHEEAATIEVQVTATDSVGAAFSESFTVNVSDVNEGPSDVSMTGGVVAENAAGAMVGTISVVDPDAGDSHSFEVSDDRFEVVNGELRLREGVALDHEDAASVQVEVTATDSGGATLTESFTIAVTDVNEGPSDVALSGGVVAENAAGAVVGTISVVDPDAGDSHTFEVSDDRFEVVDGELRLRDGVALDHDDAASVEVQVTATDSSGASVTEGFTIEVMDMPSLNVGSGFHARYFDMEHSLKKLDDVDWSMDPTHEEVTSDIQYTNSRGSFWEDGATDTFGVQITGTVEVTESGTFDFHLGGDDGAILYVNGEPVIIDDGEHGYRTRSGEIELEPGTHHIEVRYFENYGHAGLRLEWEGPGIEGRENVMAPEFADTQTVSGVPVAVDIALDTESMPDTGSLLIESLPEGTEVFAGENSFVVGPDGVADITGWSIDVLSIRPPVDFVGDINAAVVLEIETDAGGTVRQEHGLPIEVGVPDITPPEVDIVGGFEASYFDVDHKLRTIDDINWDSEPTHREMVEDINYKNSKESFWEDGSKDTFGVRLEGEVTIEEGGSYKFYAGGDDGVVVYINGEPVIDNDGLHGYRTRSGEIELEPGTYDIEVRYFENYGHAGLRVEWEGPDTDGRELLQADPELAIEENGTLNIGLDLGDASDTAGVEMVGLPADTILISGDSSIVTDGTSVDLSGWDLNMLEISPPPGFEGTVSGEVILTDTAFNGAETKSSTEFSFDVGDASANSEASGNMEEHVALTSADQNPDAAGWDSSGAEDEGSREAEDDVMSEPATMPPSSDMSDMNVEGYERLDY
ncbi:MAG: PA14 domain-containing protein [Pseudomonadota bacterium]